MTELVAVDEEVLVVGLVAAELKWCVSLKLQ